MKTTGILIIICLVSFSCMNGQNNESYLEKLQRIAKEEVGSGKINNKIYLDFNLGMSQSDFKKKCDDMVLNGSFDKFINANVVSMELWFGYPYKFQLMDYSMQSFVQYEFYNDKLYTLDILIHEENRNTVLKDLVNHFSKKYGKYSVTDNLRYNWISGNRYIQVADLKKFQKGAYKIHFEDLLVTFEKEKKNNSK